MKHSSKRSFSDISVLVAICAMGMTGCESLQRKLVRQPKQPAAPPSPVVTFQDYSRAMTPLDRYRKHYMMFDYWNDDLLRSLETPPFNPKRISRASEEALTELTTMQDLMSDDLAPTFAPLIEERVKLDQQLQGRSFSDAQAPFVRRTLEAQTRQIHRQFFWRDVQDHLKPQS